MTLNQIAFIIALLVTFILFGISVARYVRYFSYTKRGYPIRQIGKRLMTMLKVSFGQTKIMRRPLIGFAHALVFWGFCFILVGSIEMVIDGVFGIEKSLSVLGWLHTAIMAIGDVFGLIILIAIVVFLFRRLFMHIKRFEGIEMKHRSHRDANISLTTILLLMVSLLGMNTAYVAHCQAIAEPVVGAYPVSAMLAALYNGVAPETVFVHYRIFWWSHIMLICAFANYLPYSKHFHVFMSVPNTFISRLEPLGKLRNMENVTREVKLMMNPDTAFAEAPADAPIERFGVKDADDVIWNTYFNSLSCTECGRCTSVCPANITGKRLSPRKLMMDLRARMKEKGPLLKQNGRDYDDGRSLLRDFITEEELWACTTCNACAQECPININQPSLVVEMRRYLVMEEGSAPGEIKAMLSNIENNGAPWQYSPEDRLNWANDLEINR